jgi:pilus assembly protein CpaB
MRHRTLWTLSRHRKTWMVLAVALSTGGLAAWGTQDLIERQIALIESRSQVTMRSVVVAKHDLSAGEVLSADHLAIRDIPSDWAASGSVLPEQFERANGQALSAHLRAGETLMWSMLEARRAPTFSARVGPGRRAITLPVDEINSISGMLQPEDRIDLLLTVERGGQKTTLALMDQVRVMATGQRADPAQGEGAGRLYSTVTLDVASTDAEHLILARETGRLTALLRHPDDRSGPAGAQQDLQAWLAQPPAPVQATKARSIPILYGGQPQALQAQDTDLPRSVSAWLDQRLGTTSPQP